MNEKQRAKWGEVRDKGKWSFVFWYGLLGWGGPVLVFTLLLDYATFPEGLNVPKLMRSVLLVGAGGALWGLVMWYIGEREYGKQLQ